MFSNKSHFNKWSSPVTYLLAIICEVVGFGNLINFIPDMYAFGGANYILQYIIVTIFISIPVIYLELLIGQSFRKSYVGMWTDMCPCLRGVGYSTLAMNIYSLSYYGGITAFALHNFIHSLQYPNIWSINASSVKQNRTIFSSNVEDYEICAIGLDPDYFPAFLIVIVLNFAHIYKGTLSIGKSACIYSFYNIAAIFILLAKTACLKHSIKSLSLLFSARMEKSY
ncbi:hypothetical protein GJ496_001028 [Pomphorhynchus laevis]|nr:hypothetical protein GJ496_001028 [Pomphorhynchus laevis]